MEQISLTTFKIEDLFTPGIAKMINSQDKLDAKLYGMDKRMGKAFSGIGGKMSNFAQKHSVMVNEVSNQIPMIGGNLALLANPYAAAAAGVAALGAGYLAAGRMAADWEKGMALINVTASLSKPALGELSNQILNIGERARGTNLMDVPAAFNSIISAGLDVNSSLRALEPTLMASKAGFTDVKVAADAAVSVMNSAGVKDATQVYDILFKTMKDGKVEFKDIAQYLPKIIPSALAAGFSLEQTAGAYAYLTASGQTAERSTTLLENSFKALSDPDKIKRFKAIGISLYDTKGNMQPLVTIADQLNKKLGGLTDLKRSSILDSLGLDMEAKGGLLALTKDIGALRSIIEHTSHAQGGLSQAYKDSATSGDVWSEIINRAGRGIIAIGSTSLPIFKGMGDAVLSLIDWTSDFYNKNLAVRDMVSALGTGFEVAFNLAMRPIRTVGNLLGIIGDVLGVAGERLGFVSGGFGAMYSQVRPYLMWIYDIIANIADIGFKVSSLDFKGAATSFKNFEMPDLNKLKRETTEEYKKQNASKLLGVADPAANKKPSAVNSVVSAAGGSLPGGGSGNGSGRSVSVQINKLVEKIEIHVVQAGRESYRDIERTITEVLTKAVRDSEIALSTD